MKRVGSEFREPIQRPSDQLQPRVPPAPPVPPCGANESDPPPQPRSHRPPNAADDKPIPLRFRPPRSPAPKPHLGDPAHPTRRVEAPDPKLCDQLDSRPECGHLHPPPKYRYPTDSKPHDALLRVVQLRVPYQPIRNESVGDSRRDGQKASPPTTPPTTL